MRAVFTLLPAESKRLIAKGVVQLPEVRQALQSGKVVIPRGTTNAFIVEELLQIKLDIPKYVGGVVTQGRMCVTPQQERIKAYVLVNGQVSEMTMQQALEDFQAHDVFIKGANAIDAEGNVGILLAIPTGSTIGEAIGYLTARGSNLIIPVGLEKMIPSVKKAAAAAGIKTFDLSLGIPVGLICVGYGKVITEIEALEILAGVKATCLAAGGVGGSEGAVVLSIEGEQQQVEKAFDLVKKIKGEPRTGSFKQPCPCSEPCNYMK